MDRLLTINPADVGTHVLDGAVALPLGPAPKADLLKASSVSAEDLVCGRDGGAVIRIKPSGEIHIGANAQHDIACADKVADELARVKGDIAAIAGLLKGPSAPPVGPPPAGTWVPTPMDGGAGLQVAANAALSQVPSDPGSVASDKGKVE